MGTILKSIPDSIITLYSDYRSGTAIDFGPLQRHGTFPAGNVTFSIAGAHFQSTGRIVHPDHIAGRNTTGSIVLLGRYFIGTTATQYLFQANDAGGTRIRIATSDKLYSMGGTSRYVAATGTKSCLGINYTSGDIPVGYTNGVLVGNFDGTSTFTADDAAITIGNFYTGTAACLQIIACVLETNRPLTASEHSAVYSELSERKFPTRTYSIRQSDVSPNPNEPGLVWAPDLQHPANDGTVPDLSPTGATATKVGVTEPSFSFDGIGAGRNFNGANGYTATGTSFTKQNDFTASVLLKMGNTGLTYKYIIGQRGRWILALYGTTARIYINGSTTNFGTVPLLSGLGYVFTVVVAADGSSLLYINGSYFATAATAGAAAGSGEFDLGQNNLSSYFDGKVYRAEIYNYAMTSSQVRSLYERSGLKQIQETSCWGVPVSTASRGGTTGQYLESTRFQFGSATPRYTVDVATIQGETVKTLKCGTAGYLTKKCDSHFTPQQCAYGQWDISFNRAGLPYYHFISDSSNNGYLISWQSDKFILGRVDAGVWAGDISTRAVTLSASTWYQFRITRSFAGVFTCSLKGGIYTDWQTWSAGTNNTYTTSVAQKLDLDAGDMVSIGTAGGNYAMTWGPF